MKKQSAFCAYRTNILCMQQNTLTIITSCGILNVNNVHVLKGKYGLSNGACHCFSEKHIYGGNKI